MIFRTKCKALVVDGEPPFGRLLVEMLSRSNWETEFANSAEEALERLKASHFDVLITDYSMSRGNGFHFICCLRRDGITVPVILMSDDAHILRMTPMVLLTIPAVVLRPFTLADLQTALAKVFPV